MSQEKLKAVFAHTLEIPLADVNDTLAYGVAATWDSIAHMALIAAIEGAFDIMIETDDVIDMSSFAKACEIVRKYGVDA
jgi:acyl carrier protein